MYRLKPPHVFVHRRVYENARAVRRLMGMLRALGDPPTEDVGDEDTDRVIRAAGVESFPEHLARRPRQGIHKRCEDPVFLFNTFVWDARRQAPVPKEHQNSCAARVARLMAGAGEDFAFSRRELHDPNRTFVCQGGWGIHSLRGCVHKCDYCEEGYIVNVMLDLEDFAEHVLDMTRRRPEQKLYRYDLYGDSICLEPEYGASAVLSECFSMTDDKYLLYYTKSDNVDHLLHLPHKDHTIFYCTLSTESVCRDIERDTPTMEARIEGLRKCQEAGYLVRVGFSPIIPTRRWRQEATACLEQLFAAVRPETVRLWVISMMSCRETEILLGPERLDPEFLDAMRRAAPRLGCTWNAPFPVEARAEIYRHYLTEIRRISPQTPVSLCSEQQEAWDLLADVLDMRPDRLYCCCGGTSTPPARGRQQTGPETGSTTPR